LAPQCGDSRSASQIGDGGSVHRVEPRLAFEHLPANGRLLDYKEQLPGGGDPDKKEFLADVTSFANSAGGDLVFGIRERRKGGRNTGEAGAVVGLPKVSLDQEILRLDAILRTGMDPRVPGLGLHPVPRGNNPPCLVIRIPRSPHGIHMVTYGGTRRFYGRGAAGRFELNWNQIRDGFLQAEGAHERVRRFRQERVLRLLAGETPIPMGTTPKVIFHALPLNALDVWPVFVDLADNQRAQVLTPMGGEPSNWRYNLDGFVVHTTRDDPSRQTYVQCFRDGGLEAMSGAALDGSPQGDGFYGQGLEIRVVQVLTRWQRMWRLLGVAGPVMLGLTLSGVKGLRVLSAQSAGLWSSPAEAMDRDVVMLPESVVQDLTTPVPAMLQPIFDVMWNGGGWSRSPSYSGPGVLRQQPNL
jgi:hypothetical protein